MRTLTFVVVLAASVAAQPAAVTVGTATAKVGEVAYGALQAPAGLDAARTISVAVVKGAKPGKTVAFVAGSHGTEYASIVALTRLAARDRSSRRSPARSSSLPLLNAASFEQMTVHVNPVDKKGMNAGYPGNAAGTQSERALALVADQIVKPADIVVDLHGGDLDEHLRPYSYWTRTGNAAQDDAARALVLAFGLDYVILRDIDVANPASTRSLGGYSLAQGKTTLIAEAGRSGLALDADVDALVNGCLNVLGTLKMVPRAVTPIAQPVFVAPAPGRSRRTGNVLCDREARHAREGGRRDRRHDRLRRPPHRRDQSARRRAHHLHSRRAVDVARRHPRERVADSRDGAAGPEAVVSCG